MKINNKFNFSEEVFLITDPEQKLRIVTGMILRPNGGIIYELSCSTETSTHYEYEMTLERNVLL